jgi:hypothetical protein
MDFWFVPYMISQFLIWIIGDGIHLILDTELAKGTLYFPNAGNTGRKRKSNGEINWKPKYSRFTSSLFKLLVGYIYSKIVGIKNFKKGE